MATITVAKERVNSGVPADGASVQLPASEVGENEALRAGVVQRPMRCQSQPGCAAPDRRSAVARGPQVSTTGAVLQCHNVLSSVECLQRRILPNFAGKECQLHSQLQDSAKASIVIHGKCLYVTDMRQGFRGWKWEYMWTTLCSNNA